MERIGMNKTRLIEIYDAAIVKYEGEVKGFTLMREREERCNKYAEYIKVINIELWKKEIRQAKYNLTRVKNLRKKVLNGRS